MRDIVDDIDALVDEQLQQEPSGYDHNINQSQCWHCGRDFHGLPITERMERMRREYLYTGSVERLSQYRYADDDSAILCLGSTAIGPARPALRRTYFDDVLVLSSAAYVQRALSLSMPWIPDVANVRDAALDLLRDEQGEPIPEREYHPGGVVPSGTAVSSHAWMDIGYIDPDHAPCFERDAPYLHAPDIQDGDLVGYEDIITGETVTGRATVQQDGDAWSITIGDSQ